MIKEICTCSALFSLFVFSFGQGVEETISSSQVSRSTYMGKLKWVDCDTFTFCQTKTHSAYYLVPGDLDPTLQWTNTSPGVFLCDAGINSMTDCWPYTKDLYLYKKGVKQIAQEESRIVKMNDIPIPDGVYRFSSTKIFDVKNMFIWPTADLSACGYLEATCFTTLATCEDCKSAAGFQTKTPIVIIMIRMVRTIIADIYRIYKRNEKDTTGSTSMIGKVFGITMFLYQLLSLVYDIFQFGWYSTTGNMMMFQIYNLDFELLLILRLHIIISTLKPALDSFLLLSILAYLPGVFYGMWPYLYMWIPIMLLFSDWNSKGLSLSPSMIKTMEYSKTPIYLISWLFMTFSLSGMLLYNGHISYVQGFYLTSTVRPSISSYVSDSWPNVII